MRKTLLIFACVLSTVAAAAQPDSLQQDGDHHFQIDATLWSRGEYRRGALPDENGADYALFMASKALVTVDYDRKGMEVRFAPKYSGVWGAQGAGGVSIDEAWFGLKHKGFFLRLGRQALEYDDERIIGDDDWVVAAGRHDVLKTGYEGGKHKAHLLLAFNQNNEGTNGGTYYVNGAQPYKSMQAIWYHFDPVPQLGASLLFMNTAMQDQDEGRKAANITGQQQLLGAYADWHPQNFRLQASYYRQTGQDEHLLPIKAWMTSIEADWQASAAWSLNTGYYFMSGDEYYYVPKQGAFGLSLKKEVRGFNPIFGSHHEFYGAMDFFYVQTYYGGNTPGLQDFHVGANWNPVPAVSLGATYHFLGTGVKLKDASRALGHEVEVSASWQIGKDVSLNAGYSFMKGTETMARLKRTGDRNRLQWGWLMLTVTPEFFSYRF